MDQHNILGHNILRLQEHLLDKADILLVICNDLLDIHHQLELGDYEINISKIKRAINVGLLLKKFPNFQNITNDHTYAKNMPELAEEEIENACIKLGLNRESRF